MLERVEARQVDAFVVVRVGPNETSEEERLADREKDEREWLEERTESRGGYWRIVSIATARR